MVISKYVRITNFSSPIKMRGSYEEFMMSRGVGLISVLLAMTVALAACDGDSSGTSASQATGVANTSASLTAAAQSNDSTSTDAARASPLPCDAAATAN